MTRRRMLKSLFTYIIHRNIYIYIYNIYIYIIYIYIYSIEESNLVNQILEEIAKKYRNVKIVKIVGDKCIETLPIEKCPGFVVYENGQLITQLIPAVGELGGQNMNFKCKMIYKYYIQLWNGFLEC